MRKKMRKVLVLLTTLAICVSTLNINVYAQENCSTEQSTTEVTVNNETQTVMGDEEKKEDIQGDWDGITTEKIYETEGYRIIFTLTSYWQDGYNANIQIINTGNSIIENWYLDYTSKNTITHIWNAEINSYEKQKYIIKNACWNQNIESGKSVEFGISGNEQFLGFPTVCILSNIEKESEKEDYSALY